VYVTDNRLLNTVVMLKTPIQREEAKLVDGPVRVNILREIHSTANLVEASDH